MGALQKVVTPPTKDIVFVTDAAPLGLPLQQLRTVSPGCEGFGATEYRNEFICLELQSLLNLRGELVFSFSLRLPESTKTTNIRERCSRQRQINSLSMGRLLPWTHLNLRGNGEH